MYKTDKEIEQEFNNFKIIKITKHFNCSGWIEVSFPNGKEHVGGGTNFISDNWIKYSHNNKIAFNNWYPDYVYYALCDAINKKWYS